LVSVLDYTAVFNVPWAADSISAGEFFFYPYSDTEFVSDIIVPQADAVDPQDTDTLLQVRRAKGGSAPVLRAESRWPSYRFVGWKVGEATLTGNVAPDFSGSFSWGSYPAAWPAEMKADRAVRPIYVRQLPLQLSLQSPSADTAEYVQFFAKQAADPTHANSAQGGIRVPVNNTSPQQLTETKRYDYNSSFTITAQPGEHHVLSKWIIEKATGDSGDVYAAADKVEITGADGAEPSRTYTLTLDYPAKVTAVMVWENHELTVNVADSRDGQKHGKIKVAGTPAAGSVQEVRTFGYSSEPQITAVPEDGYAFTGWTVTPGASPSGSSNAAVPGALETTVFVDGNKTLTAHFARKVTLTIKTDPLSLGENYSTMTTPQAGVYGEGSLISGQPVLDGGTYSVSALTGHNEGYDFIQWQREDDSHTAASPDILPTNPLSVTLDGNTVLTAIYSKLFSLTVSVGLTNDALPATAEESKVSVTPRTYNNTTLVAMGTAPTSGKFRALDNVVATATAGTNFEFDHWELSIGGVRQPDVSTAELTVGSLTADTEAKAIFKPKNYTVTLTPASPDALRPIATALAGLNNTQTHDFLPDGQSTWTLPYGSTIRVSTAAGQHYAFVAWQENGATLSTTSPYEFVLTGNKTLTATFKRSHYTLTYVVAPSGTGTVTYDDVSGTALAPTSIQPAGSYVDIRANDLPTGAAPYTYGSVFDGWTGDAAGSARQLQVLMDKDRTITANFKNAVGLTLATNDASYGTATSVGLAARRTSGSVLIFAVGDKVRIKAVPTTVHHEFKNWEFTPATPVDVTNLQSDDFTFELLENLTAKANFDRKEYTLKITATANGAVVPPSDVAIKLIADEGLAGEHNFLSNDTLKRLYETRSVLVKAEAKVVETTGPRFRFEKWVERPSGAVNTLNPMNFVFDRNAQYEANFIQQARITINEGRDDTYGTPGPLLPGTVSPVGVHNYDVKTSVETVTITATAPTGYEFDRWVGNVDNASSNNVVPDRTSAALTYNITVGMAGSGDVDITPVFKKRHYHITTAVWDRVTQAPLGANVIITPAPEIEGDYYFDKQITVSVDSVSDGYRFLGWDINGDHTVDISAESGLSYTFRVSGEATITAIMTRVCYLTLSATPRDLSLGRADLVSPAPVSSVTLPDGGGIRYEYAYGTAVKIKATPAPAPLPPDVGGGVFSTWVGYVAEPRSLETTVILDIDRTIYAMFTPLVLRTLKVESNPAGIGSFAVENYPVPNGWSAGFAEMSSIQVDALDYKSMGYVFKSWTPVADVTNRDTVRTYVLMDKDKTITANYVAGRFKLTVMASPAAGGRVEGVEANATYPYVNGQPQTAQISAIASPGYRFVAWDFGPVTPDVTVSVDEDKTVTAIFESVNNPVGLLIVANPSGSAQYTVTNSTDPMDPPNTKIITVSPLGNYRFSTPTWGGPSEPELSRVVDDGAVRIAKIVLEGTEQKSLVVNLSLPKFSLSVDTWPREAAFSVDVSSGPDFLPDDPPVVLKPRTSDNNYRFDHWEGDVTGSGDPIEFKVNRDMAVRAHFVKVPRKFALSFGFDLLSIAAADDSVSMEGASLRFGDSDGGRVALTTLVDENASVRLELTETAQASYGFSRWTGVDTSKLAVYGRLAAVLIVQDSYNPRALYEMRQRILTTEARMDGETEHDWSAFPSPLESAGGEVTAGGILPLGQNTMAVIATPKAGVRISHWEVFKGQAEFVNGTGVAGDQSVMVRVDSPLAGVRPVFISDSVHRLPLEVRIDHRLPEDGTKASIEGNKGGTPPHYIKETDAN
jgi:uncharacterized repeat protein (TIGR02543 family)